MNLLSKAVMLFTFINVIHCAQGMKPFKKPSMSYEEAVSYVRMGHGMGALYTYIEGAQDLNRVQRELDPHTNETILLYPVQSIIIQQWDTDAVIVALEKGARTDRRNSKSETLFHNIGCSSIRVGDSISSFRVRQNLLAAMALPTYCYPEIIQAPTIEALIDKVLRSPCSVVNSFLMCLQKLECAQLKQVKPCILKYLIDASCSQKIFNMTLPLMNEPGLLITRFPFVRFASIAQTKDDNDNREKFVALYAPLFARYRLTAVAKILQMQDKEGRTAFAKAQSTADYHHVSGRPGIIDAEIMEADLDPEGFIDRHMDECTRIIKNKLLGLDPFDGFPHFSKDVES